MNINLRLDDWHQARGADLRGCFKLLVHDLFDARCVGLFDERPHLGSENALYVGLVEKRSKSGHWPHQLDTVLLCCPALIDFQKGTMRWTVQRSSAIAGSSMSERPQARIEQDDGTEQGAQDAQAVATIKIKIDLAPANQEPTD